MVSFLTSIVIAVSIGVVGYIVALLLGRLVHRITSKFLNASWSGFIANLARLGIAILTIKIIVDQTGAAGAFAVIIAALTGAFAIGSERLAADLVAGLKLLFLNYYDVGELVTIAKHMGRVEEVSLTHTVLATFRRDRVIIPNSDALAQIVVNHSKIPGHKVNVRIPIPGPHDREQVMEIMRVAAVKYTSRMDPPIVVLNEIGINTSYYRVMVLVREEDWKPIVAEHVLLVIVNGLEAAGIPVGEAEAVRFAER
ncbi:MAG: mechanosensitive ion channel [Chloroflexi bacterium]|nr:mechanosensitive ion channel [Chloroflexota bacterium]